MALSFFVGDSSTAWKESRLVIILEKKIVGIERECAGTVRLTRARRAAGLRGIGECLVTSSAAMRSLNYAFAE